MADDSFVTRVNDTNIRLQWFGPRVLRVKAWQSDKEPADDSFARIAEPDGTHAPATDERNDCWVVSSEALTAEISKEDGHITFLDGSGGELLREQPGARAFIANELPNPEDRLTVQQKWTLADDVALYGLGQFPNGVINWRGHDARLIQGNVIVVNPFLLSNRNWGILWDNPSHTEFHDGDDGMSFWSEVADALDYYVCVGDSADEVISGYRHLTGRAPLFGIWAYGFWQCKERYKSADELRSVVEEYRRRRLPLDNIVQDWCYWGDWSYGENWSGMFVLEEQFGDLYGAIRKIHDMNAKVMISIWPMLGNSTAIAKELDSKGHMFGTIGWNKARIYDAFSEEARAIYWRYAKEGLFDHGIDAWWMDATEPEFRDPHDPLANKAVACSNKDTAAGSWARVLNAFSLMTTKGVYEGQREATEKKRVFILTRSAFAGQQRYSAATWSGDIGSSWPIFAGQVSAGLNFCMAGIPYWTTDNGGFFVRGHGSQFPRGVEDPAFRELFVRWFQWSAFCPLMRSHGTQTPREIWQFGDEGEPFYEALVAFDHLRYRLLPYIYSLAGKVTLDDYTMMRGLAMDFPDDATACNVRDQFMFGPAFMTCPVTKPMYHLPSEAIDVVHTHDLVDEDGVTGALTACHFDDIELSKQVEQKRVHTIDFSWAGSGPGGVTGSAYSIRLTGSLCTPPEGAHGLVFRADNGLCAEIGGDLVVDDWNAGPVREHRVDLELGAGQTVTVSVEYFHPEGDSVLQVGWIRRGAEAQDPDSIARERDVYLPAGTWYDFWTGETLAGEQTHIRPSGIELIPVLVRAGSIVPMGPKKQWSTEKPADPIELRIYPGADGSFTLYEDAGDGYEYERGEYATIDLRWNDSTTTLIIGERKGSFPGMLTRRTFNAIIVREEHGAGIEPTAEIDCEIVYEGGAQEVSIAGNAE